MLGGRAYVNHIQKTMQLYNFSYDKTIIHEFGHILGFRDKYYTYWVPSQCTYVDQYSLGDIMSEPSTGIVLLEHWKKIKEVYWKKE